MSVFAVSFQSLLLGMGLALVVGYLGWGMHPLLRTRRKQIIRREHRVRFASEVNTALMGYQISKNHSSVVVWSVVLLALLVWHPNDAFLLLACLAYGVFLMRHLYLHAEFQVMQSYMLTDKGVYVFLERKGLKSWEQRHPLYVSWQEVEGYRIDGSLLQLFQGERMLLQLEFALHDYEKVRHVLYDLNVLRLEMSDRIWVAQLDEQAFYLFEDVTCELGWELLDLFREELQEMKLKPEFGVMRNIPGDRLLEENARSWIQMNLLDLESGERRFTSAFPLWQSYGNVGYFNGAVGQDMIDRLQYWIKKVLTEAQTAEEGVVS